MLRPSAKATQGDEMTSTLQPPQSFADEPMPERSDAVDVAAATRADDTSADRSARRWHPVVLLVVACTVAAAAIHFAMAPSHMQESTVEGWGFVVTAWLQICVAAWLVIRPSRPAALSAAALSVATISAWAIARTVGLPFVGEGHHNTVDVVDGVTVALEGVALLGALTLLGVLRSPSASRPIGSAAKALAVPAFAAPLIAASIALLSPSATGHGSHSTAFGPGYDLLANGHQHDIADRPYTPEERAEITRVTNATAPLMQKYPTMADAEAAGYRKAGPYAPAVGQHMNPPVLGEGLDTDGELTPEEMAGAMLIYDGYAPDAKLAGFMVLSMAATTPEGFAGTYDHWHSHSDVCLVYKDDGTIDSPFGADTGNVPKALCDAEGGTLMPTTPYMVHVWNVPGYLSPEGMFSELNPALTCDGGHYYMVPMEKLAALESACDDAKFQAESA